jgi:hypothetical protein
LTFPIVEPLEVAAIDDAYKRGEAGGPPMILKNARCENIALLLADGMSQEKAYVQAGYSPKSARCNCSTLLKHNPTILERRDEILKEREPA